MIWRPLIFGIYFKYDKLHANKNVRISKVPSVFPKMLDANKDDENSSEDCVIDNIFNWFNKTSAIRITAIIIEIAILFLFFKKTSKRNSSNETRKWRPSC